MSPKKASIKANKKSTATHEYPVKKAFLIIISSLKKRPKGGQAVIAKSPAMKSRDECGIIRKRPLALAVVQLPDPR